MKSRRRSKTLISLLAGASAAAVAFGGIAGATTVPDEGGDAAGLTGGTLRIYASEPAFLVPTAADDQPAILVIRQLFSGLVDYDLEGVPVLNIAESIESEDQQNWTITLKDGYTFHNGEPVNADSFIRAWNYTADGDNAQNNSYFMSRIVGWDEAQEGADTMSGVVKVDDLTFTVELKQPFVGFVAVLGYSGFFPVAEACLADFAACNETPIGNGPYQIDGSWEHSVGITLNRFDAYPDPGKSNPDVLEYRIYADIEAGYAAYQAGEIDVMYTIPPERYQEVLSGQPDRLYELAGDSFTFVGLPLYLEQFQNPDVRRALSMAIDRQPIIDNVFDGRFSAADGLVSPNFDGYREGACDACVYDPEGAAALLEASRRLARGDADPRGQRRRRPRDVAAGSR